MAPGIEQQRGEVMLLPENDGRVALPPLLARLGIAAAWTCWSRAAGSCSAPSSMQHLIDRVQAVVAPMIIGGVEAPVAVAGLGVERMADAARLEDVSVRRLGADLLVEGNIRALERD